MKRCTARKARGREAYCHHLAPAKREINKKPFLELTAERGRSSTTSEGSFYRESLKVAGRSYRVQKKAVTREDARQEGRFFHRRRGGALARGEGPVSWGENEKGKGDIVPLEKLHRDKKKSINA